MGWRLNFSSFKLSSCPHTDPHHVVFHPVWTDARVQHPSHFKRFEVQMFAFAENEEDLSLQVTRPVKTNHFMVQKTAHANQYS